MLHPSLAIGWTIWRRHRYGLLLLVGYLLAAVIAAAVLPGFFSAPAGGIIAALLTMPLGYAVMYVIVVFSYGAEADLNARESCFPAGLLTLPVRTAALAGWPIVFGAAAVALLWLTTAGLILRPVTSLNLTVPLWWPAALSMAVAALVQALLWCSFGLPFVRIVLGVLVICAAVTAAQIAAAIGVSEGILVALFVGIAALGWTSAYMGVRRGRCGEVPDWTKLSRLWHALGAPRLGHKKPFVSAGGAQVWFEWRRTGLSLPLMTALVLPFVLLPLCWGENDALPISRTLLLSLVAPLFLAGIAGTTVSGTNAWVKDYYGVTTFTATLPMSTAGMVAAKLKAAAQSTLAAWLIVAVATPLAVWLTGNWPAVAGWWSRGAESHHPAKIIVGISAAGSLLIVWTWKNLVNSLFLGLTGRKWVIQGTLIAGMAVLLCLWWLGAWIYNHPETHGRTRQLLPWCMGLLVFCRIALAVWALQRGIALGLFESKTIVRWIATWVCLASALIGLLAWSVPAERIPVRYVALGVISVLPMVRLASTPLALAWNRHR